MLKFQLKILVGPVEDESKFLWLASILIRNLLMPPLRSALLLEHHIVN